MRPAAPYRYPPEHDRLRRRAIRLEILTIAYTFTTLTLTWLVMGASQAMKTSWFEDLISLMPPVTYLAAHFIRYRPPNPRYPYGMHRAASIGFLIASVALSLVGAWLAVEACLTLIHAEPPSVGMQSFFGVDLWLGWWMLAVLAYATLPPVLLGRAKMKLARPLYDKLLYTDAKMNKADWMTAVAAGIGVVGIGLGWWWLDGVAALFISLDILRDGLRQMKDAVTGLMDRAPTTLDSEFEDIPERVRTILLSEHWIEDADVRLREEGPLLFGEGYFMSRDDAPVAPEQLREAVDKVKAIDWRLQDFALTPMARRGE